MRFRSRARGVLLLLSLGAANPSAQTGGVAPPGDPSRPDSIAIPALDEQAVEHSADEENEREEEDPGAGSTRGWSMRWRLRGTATLQASEGFTAGEYSGDRSKLYQRLDVRRGSSLHVAVLTEKDPGEKSPVDFLSAMAALEGLPGGLRVVCGDFRLRGGQGLLFGDARSFGKGAAVIEPAFRSAWGIPDGLSSDEVHFFRGIAIGAGSAPAGGIVFGSVRRLSPLITPVGEVRGIDRTGYHRTATERGRAGRLTDRSAGALVRFSAGPLLSAGAGVLISSIRTTPSADGTLVSAPGAPARAAADLRAGAGPVMVFAEGMFSSSRAAWIAGALFGGAAGERVVVVRRFYPESRGIARTFGFADGSAGGNESGTYLAAEMPVAGRIFASAYLDLFSSPGPSSGAFFPPRGVDRSVSVRARPGGLTIEARYRCRLVEVNRPSAEETGPAAPGNATRRTDRFRLGVGWDAARNLSCGARIEKCLTSRDSGGSAVHGLTVGAGLSAGAQGGLSVRAGMQLFEIGSDAAGFTIVEPGLPGLLTGTRLSGEGSNWYLLVSWKVSGAARISAKYSRFRRDDVRRIGSGPGELPSNVRDRAGVQVDLAW